MSQFERSSHKIVSLLRRTPAFEGQVVHRSDQGVVHAQRRLPGSAKADPPVHFVRNRGERNSQDQGLLEKTEIEDLGKVFAEVKLSLNLKSTEHLNEHEVPGSLNDAETQHPFSMTLNTSKIREMYFKKREEKKLKKLNHSIERIYASAPTTPGVNTKILNFVRNKNHMSYECNNQTQYWAEISRCVEETTHARAGNHLRIAQSRESSAPYQRENVISLQTGLPAKPYIQLSSFRKRIELREQLFDPAKKQELKGVHRKKAKTYSLNMPNGQTRSFTPNGSSIVTTLHEYFNIIEDENRKYQSKRKPTTWLPLKGESPPQQQDRYNQLKVKVENNEMSLVDCCENFLRTKAQKNHQFINLIQTVNRDRPMTQQIRLKLYTGQKSDRQRLSQLRRSAERTRKQLVAGNNDQHSWYESLVEQISKVRDEKESLRLCDYIFDSLKNLLEDGKHIQLADIHTMLTHIENDESLSINNISMFLIKRVLERFDVAMDSLSCYQKLQRYITRLQKEHLEDQYKQQLLGKP